MKALRFLLSALPIVFSAAGPVSAAGAGPFPNCRVPDPSGTWYVVVNLPDWNAETAGFRFCKKAEGSPPVKPFYAPGMGGGPKPDGLYRFEAVEPLPGDSVLASGTLPQLPRRLVVSAEGRGFLSLDHYEWSGRGDILVAVSERGTVLQRRTLADLFSEDERRAFLNTTGGLIWLSGAWIDDSAGEAVVVGVGPLGRAMSFATGKVRPLGPADVRTALDLPYPEAWRSGLELVPSLRPSGVEAKLMEWMKRPEPGLSARAAVAAASLKLPGARDAVRALVSGPERLFGERRRKEYQKVGPARDAAAEELRALDYVVRRLPEVLGPDAIPMLAAAPGELAHSVVEAFRGLGPQAVPDLLALLEGDSPNARWIAARALGEIGAREALPGLLRAMGDSDLPAAHAAGMAAVKIGKEDVAAEMQAWLEKGSKADGAVWHYFAGYRHPPSVPVLVELLARRHENVSSRASIRRALAFQTGEDLGDDPAAWRAWLEKRGK